MHKKTACFAARSRVEGLSLAPLLPKKRRPAGRTPNASRVSGTLEPRGSVWSAASWLPLWTAISAALLLASGSAIAAEPLTDEEAGDPYPLANCVIVDEPIEPGDKEINYLGREIRLCCDKCEDDFKVRQYAWIEMIDERIVAAQLDSYPLTTCVADGKPLDPALAINHVFRNRLFRVCSLECQEKIEQAPAKHFTKLNTAVMAKQKAKYPTDKCIVSGKPLGKAVHDLVVGSQLIRLAGEDQLGRFYQLPGKYLVELRELSRAKAKP